MRYSYPFLNKAQTLGFSAKAFFARAKEIGYKTAGNKLLFYRDENNFLLKRIRGSFSFNYRPKLFEYHNFEIAYRKYSTDNYVQQELNPNFFLADKNSQQYFYLDYEFIFDRRDIKPYPMHGYQLTASIRKEGLGIFKERNGLFTTAVLDKYFSFNKRWSLELNAKAKFSFIRNWHPFNNYKALGYEGDFLRGYELYVMDGLDYFYLKSSFRIKIFEKIYEFNRMMPVKAFKVMPIKIFFTINNDTGYINDPQLGEINPLGNKWLWGGGIGLNFVLYYDKVIRLEYSFNQLHERGLFFQYTLSL
ncbi:MAG TPA: hypothetical protein ENI82_04865 [Bacteroidetes bacterium]|nr:hypothetical protein [Bacteroidota bacterium]